MMKKKAIKMYRYLFVLLLFTSCVHKKVVSNIKFDDDFIDQVISEVVCNVSKESGRCENLWIRKVVWNQVNECGLIDVANANSRGTLYYPFLITKESQVINLSRGNKEMSGDFAQILSDYKMNHLNLFTEVEWILMEKRVQLGVITTHSSITSNIFAGSTPEIDSLYREDLSFEYFIRNCSKIK
jgi:hypothetical protein